MPGTWDNMARHGAGILIWGVWHDTNFTMLPPAQTEWSPATTLPLSGVWCGRGEWRGADTRCGGAAVHNKHRVRAWFGVLLQLQAVALGGCCCRPRHGEESSLLLLAMLALLTFSLCSLTIRPHAPAAGPAAKGRQPAVGATATSLLIHTLASCLPTHPAGSCSQACC